MTKSFLNSTTIRAGLKVKQNSNLKSQAALATGAIAPIILSEVGINGVLNDALSSITHGVVSGQSIESIALATGIGAVNYYLNQRKNKQLSELIIKGRIKAVPLDKTTVPLEYQ